VQPHELFGRQDAMVAAVERDLSVAAGQPRAEGREVGGRDLARPCGSGSFLRVHMRFRSGWRAIAMNEGPIEGACGTRFELQIVGFPAEAGKSSDNAPLSAARKQPICSGFQCLRLSP
jgi:hypothetical protein